MTACDSINRCKKLGAYTWKLTFGTTQNKNGKNRKIMLKNRNYHVNCSEMGYWGEQKIYRVNSNAKIYSVFRFQFSITL